LTFKLIHRWWRWTRFRYRRFRGFRWFRWFFRFRGYSFTFSYWNFSTFLKYPPTRTFSFITNRTPHTRFWFRSTRSNRTSRSWFWSTFRTRSRSWTRFRSKNFFNLSTHLSLLFSYLSKNFKHIFQPLLFLLFLLLSF